MIDLRGMEPRAELLCRMGDNALILGQRLSEWCGHGPVLEEDIALANIALDLIGQATLWLGLAGEMTGHAPDALAMRRDVYDFRNLLLVEQPNGDFGQTMMRQYLFDQWHVAQLSALSQSADEAIAGVAAKAVKEVTYHLERSRELVIGLGDGTDESHARMQAALDLLFPYVGEMFADDGIDRAMAEAGLAPLPSSLRAGFDAALSETMAEARLSLPESRFAHQGGKTGKRHSEHLGHLLAVMQFLPRAYPDAQW